MPFAQGIRTVRRMTRTNAIIAAVTVLLLGMSGALWVLFEITRQINGG